MFQAPTAPPERAAGVGCARGVDWRSPQGSQHLPVALLLMAATFACTKSSGPLSDRGLPPPPAPTVSTPDVGVASVAGEPGATVEAAASAAAADSEMAPHDSVATAPGDSQVAMASLDDSAGRTGVVQPTSTGCAAGPASAFSEPGGPRSTFSVDGYHAYNLPITRTIAGVSQVHCLRVGWPPGNVNSDGQPTRVAEGIGPSWFRAIENTLARVPWHHVLTVERVIIDNRPKEHGIAPFDRRDPDDARDGRTLWLHEHLFRDPNHWSHGNHGSYWSYHVSEDEKRIAELPSDHDQFSPVLLHELGHLVMYNVINGERADPSTPRCAHTCGDKGTCATLSQLEREAGCISPYCMPFRYPGSVENFAEQYRFHYQSSVTRGLLKRVAAGCAGMLSAQDEVGPEPHPAPWDLGLSASRYRPSLWKSCQWRACKDI